MNMTYVYLMSICLEFCGYVSSSGITGSHSNARASQVVLVVKNPRLPMQETCVQSLGWEDPLEEGMATHSSIPAWIIPQTEEPGGLHSIGLQKVRHN